MPSATNCTNDGNTVSSAGSLLGTGGMSTKIVAARLATSAGVTTIITRSSNPGNILNIVTYLQSIKKHSSLPLSRSNSKAGLSHGISETALSSTTTLLEDPLLSLSEKSGKSDKTPLHTRFVASDQPIRDRYFWLLHGLAPHGTVYIDAGAHKALVQKAGLLPVGIVDVEGQFAQQEAVRLVVVNRLPQSAASDTSNKDGRQEKLFEGPGIEVGRALVNYSAVEIARIKGVRSADILGLLGYADSEYVALRENISFFVRESRPATPAPVIAEKIAA